MKYLVFLSLFYILLPLRKTFDSKPDYKKIISAINLDSTSLITYEKRIKEFAAKKEYNSAIMICNEMMLLPELKLDSILLAKTHFRLGFYNKRIDNYEIAYSSYNDALRMYSALNDSISAANMLRSMANIQKTFGDFSGAKISAIDGLDFLGTNIDYDKRTSLYHIISISNKEEGNFIESLKWNQRVIELMQKDNERTVKPIYNVVYNNSRALILANLDRFDEGIQILKTLLEDSNVVKNRSEYARVLNNLGQIKWRANSNNDESESLLLKALEIRKEVNSASGLISSNIHLSKYYREPDAIKSLMYASGALSNAKKLKNPVSILEALDLIIPIKTELNLSLNEEASLYSITQNELTQTQQNIRSIYATTKYDNDKLTNDNLILKAQKEKKEKQNLIYLSAFLVTLMTTGFVVYYKNQQKKRIRLEATYKTEIRFAKKIHDEVGNDIFYLMTQIKLNPNMLQNKEGIMVMEGLDTVYQKARDISREYTPIKTDETYGDELKGLMHSYSSDNVKIVTTELDSNFWAAISKEKKIQLFWVLRELLTNMRKHSKATFVGITFTKTNGKLEIRYIDNGIGFKIDNRHFRNGLKNVENRMRDLNGSINFDSKSNEGLTIKMRFSI